MNSDPAADPAANPATTREYYARRYKEAKKRKIVQLYAKSTDGCVDRIESS